MEPGWCCPHPRAAPMEESKMEPRGPGQPSGLQALVCGFEVVAGQHGGYWFTPGGEVRGDCWEGHGSHGASRGSGRWDREKTACGPLATLLPIFKLDFSSCGTWSLHV